ncbi:MAG: hypothetical protein AAF907_05145, partial [Planctomycetota bacterium]
MFKLNRASARQIELSRRALDAGDIDEAIVLAALVAAAEDDSVLFDGTPARAAAAALLRKAATLDADLVRLRLGPDAAEAFEEATSRGDARALAEIAARYPGTVGGRNAEARLADLHLDAGRYAAAARLFESLADRSGAALSARGRWALKAAVALLRSGDEPAARAKLAGVSPAARTAFLSEAFPTLSAASPNVRDDAAVLELLRGGGKEILSDAQEWPLVGLRADRAPRFAGQGGPPRVNAVGEPLWTTDHIDELPPTGADGPGLVIASTVRRGRIARNESLWPAARPLALLEPRTDGSGGERLVVYAVSPRGVTATEAATGEVVWKSGLTTESVYFRLTRAEQELT